MRFERHELLGSGATGAVYRAYDSELRRDVALKTLFGVSSDLAHRLKAEFRALRGVVHPSLVQLYELVVGDIESFFTMELVRGVDVVRFVRGDLPPAAPLDGAGRDRLRHVLVQVVSAIDRLHAAARVHRDLKPSNVIVAPDGHAMVLDFGLVATLRGGVDVPEMAGTLAYMAPEQVWSAPPTPAIDWYALGVVLFEALTGAQAFAGSPVTVLRLKERGPLPSPRHLVATTSTELDALVRALLDPDPTRRPNGDGIRGVLEGRAPLAIGGASRPPSEVFVGRETELAVLATWREHARDERPHVGHVVGPSGIGKSALLRQFVERAQDALVLSSRCHPQETVPYKALDGAMEDLTRHLLRHKDESLATDGTDTGPLVSLFPSLARVPALADACEQSDGADPRELQRRGFAALRALIGRLARDRLIVLWIDDAQWGDRDSALALLDVLRPPEAPPVLLVLSYRGDEATASTFLAELERGELGAGDTMIVEPLPPSDARHLAADLLTCDDADPTVERVVHQSAGSPFFIEQLSRYRREGGGPARDVELDEAILGRVDSVGDSARAMAELVAVAGGALELAQVIELTGARDPAALVYRMREQCMLRTVATRPKSVDVYHDRIRETLLASLSTARRRGLHRQVADALQQHAAPDPEALLEHLLGAGDEAAAAGVAITAAERSVAALAFGRAAELYEMALRLRGAGDGDWPLMAAHADTLANAGLGTAGGRAYEAAADASVRAAAPKARTLGLRAAAARELLCAGEFGAGLGALERTLAIARIPFPRTPSSALARLLAARARVSLRGLGFTARREETLPAHTIAEIEACWSATIGLNAFDAVRSAAFQARHSLLALDAGEPVRVVRALAAEAVYRAAEGKRGGRARSAKLAAEVDKLAAEVGDPRARAFARLCGGVGSYFGGNWQRALTELAEAERIFRSLHGVAWEIANCRAYRFWSLAWMGDMDTLAAEAESDTAAARTRGDVLGEIGAASGHANLGWLLADRPDEARVRARAAIDRFPADTFQSPHYADLLAQARIDLYVGDGDAAWARVCEALPRLRRIYLPRLQLFRIEMRLLTGSCALAAAANGRGSGRWTRRRLLDAASRAVAQLRAEDLPLARALGDALGGILATAAGERTVAARELGAAARALDACGLRLYAESARFHAAALEGRTPPADLRLGVAPARVASMLLPGLEPGRSMLKVA